MLSSVFLDLISWKIPMQVFAIAPAAAAPLMRRPFTRACGPAAGCSADALAVYEGLRPGGRWSAEAPAVYDGLRPGGRLRVRLFTPARCPGTS